MLTVEESFVPRRILGFAQKAFIVRAGKVLLVRRSAQDPVNPLRWEVPGGRMKAGELVDHHIRREVLEEVGLEVLPGAPFHIWQWALPVSAEPGTIMDVIGVARICSCLDGEPTLDHQEPDDYLDRAAWVDIDMLANYDFIPNMAPVIAAFLHVVTERP